MVCIYPLVNFSGISSWFQRWFKIRDPTPCQGDWLWCHKFLDRRMLRIHLWKGSSNQFILALTWLTTALTDDKSYRTANLPPVSAPSENYVEVLKIFNLQKEITRKSVIKSKTYRNNQSLTKSCVKLWQFTDKINYIPKSKITHVTICSHPFHSSALTMIFLLT